MLSYHETLENSIDDLFYFWRNKLAQSTLRAQSPRRFVGTLLDHHYNSRSDRRRSTTPVLRNAKRSVVSGKRVWIDRVREPTSWVQMKGRKECGAMDECRLQQ